VPIHEYVCRNCGEELERLQKLSDAPLTDCPACGEAALKRKISAASFRLAGGGWYETDFKSEDRRNIADNGKDKSSDGTANSGSSTNSGDAAKPDKPKQTDNANKSDKSAASKPTSHAGADSA